MRPLKWYKMSTSTNKLSHFLRKMPVSDYLLGTCDLIVYVLLILQKCVTTFELWCGVYHIQYLVPIVMVKYNFYRLNVCHFSHNGTIGGRKLSSSGATIANLEGVAPWVIDVGCGVCTVATCTSHLHYNVIYISC